VGGGREAVGAGVEKGRMMADSEAILRRLGEIEARAEKATPGPWTWEEYSIGWGAVYARVLRKAAGKYQICDFATRDDAEFIACARESVPWLCQIVRQLVVLLEKQEAAAEAARELLKVLPDSANGEDWEWAWDQLYTDSQEHVKEARERARKVLAALEGEHVQ